MYKMMDNSIIKIKLEIWGLLHIDAVDDKSTLLLDKGTTISGLLKSLKVSKVHQSFISAFVNNEEKKQLTVLKDNDIVKLFLPIGGG